MVDLHDENIAKAAFFRLLMLAILISRYLPELLKNDHLQICEFCSARYQKVLIAEIPKTYWVCLRSSH